MTAPTTIDHDTGEIADDQRIATVGGLRFELAIATTLDEKRAVREKAEIFKQIAKRAANLELQNHYAEIGLDTDREIGSELADMPDAYGNRYTKLEGNTVLPSSDMPTLDDLGITKIQSSRWQTLAAIDEDTYHTYIEETKENQGEISRAGLLRYAHKDDPEEQEETPDTPLDTVAADEDKPGEEKKLDGDEWYTPEQFIEAARELMGSIDLDPATCEAAQQIVRAAQWYTKEDNSLDKPWFDQHGNPANVWCNPPYSMKLIQQFTQKLIDEYDSGNIRSAVYLVNNCTDAGWFHSLMARFPMCFTRGRVRFWRPDKTTFATRQGQVFFYLGNNTDRFVDIFSQFGIVVANISNEVSE